MEIAGRFRCAERSRCWLQPRFQSSVTTCASQSGQLYLAPLDQTFCRQLSGTRCESAMFCN